MIDFANYKRAIDWLKRGMKEQSNEPENGMVRDSLTHSVGVTYNITESILRQVLIELSDDTTIPRLSSRELMRYAAEEGLPLTSGTAWLRYGLALEQAHETLGDSFTETVVPLLAQYAQDLEIFASRLEGRLTQNV